MVEGLSWTYCGQFCSWTTGAKEHRTTTHIHREVPLENPREANPPDAPTEAPDPPSGVLSQAVLTNNTARGVYPKSSMEADLGGYIFIGGESVYDGVSLSITVHLFIGGDVTSGSKPPIPDDIDVGAPDLCSYDLFFGNDIQDKLDYDAFYDAVETDHNTGALATDTKVTTPSEESSLSNHPVNQDSESSDSEDEPEPPGHAAPGLCH